MSAIKKCKCCSGDENLMDLWGDNESDSVYGDMLNECFLLNWPKSLYDQICTNCTSQLQVAYSFYQILLSTQENYIREMASGKDEQKSVLKSDPDYGPDDFDEDDGTVDELDRKSTVEATVTDVDEDIFDDDHDQFIEEDELDIKMSPDTREINMEEEVIEYLEDDLDAQYALDLPSKEESAIPKAIPKTRKRKSVSKGLYMKYSQTDLATAVEMVKNHRMTRAQASEAYNIPRRTLAAKLMKKEAKVKINVDRSSEDGRKKTKITVEKKKFLEEILVLLTYTNIVPFKIRLGRYHCVYCTTIGPAFDNTEPVRTHTVENHAHERLKFQSVVKFMKPFFLNEILRVDIKDLHCTNCNSPMKDWEVLFEHLKDVHSLEFEFATKMVIPYVLTDDLKCALCGEESPQIHLLDIHMNAHYTNYMCGMCGNTFLTESRFKNHLERHNTGKYPCKECGKVFSRANQLQQHMTSVHIKPKNVGVRCHHCDKRFETPHSRHLHILEHHKDQIKPYCCSICNAQFTLQKHFTRHSRIAHNDKEFVCGLCNRAFSQKCLLKRHMKRHEYLRQNVK